MDSGDNGTIYITEIVNRYEFNTKLPQIYVNMLKLH
jgi:hypothetical protein